MASTWRRLEAFWASMSPLLPPAPDPGSKCATIGRADRFARQWRAYGRGDRSATLLAELLKCWQSKPGVTQKWWDSKNHAKQAEALHAAFRDDVVLPHLTAWRQYLYRRCVALLMRGRDAARADRHRRSALTFNDLLILTATVLRTNGAVRRALQQKYRWLLVDEFQDTDPVQAEIMFLLASDHSSQGEADWRTVALRPGALFVVGDPKQSIYRFRRADIDIYNEVRARLAGGDGRGLVQLTTNFRSVPALCAWANDVFQRRFPAVPTPQAPMFAPLDPARDPVESAPALATIELPATKDAADVAFEEPAQIARYIQAEVAAGRRC
jgi:ATP-dependent helicase/nuclease subunit A